VRSRIPAGGLDDLLAGFQNPALLRIPHHGRANAVFHRIGGVAAFDLGQHGYRRAIGNAIDAHQGRTPDAE
jgi:hypothetical protein